MIYTYSDPCFDLQQIHQSGQCFRMIPLPEETYGKETGEGGIRPEDTGRNRPDQDSASPEGVRNGYRIISGSRLLHAWQDRSLIYFDCREEDLDFWLSYFDMDRDYEAVISSIDREDHYLLEAARCGKGIRILRQDPWEMIITFVISQQKTIPSIRQLVEALSSRYGTPLREEQVQSTALSPQGDSPEVSTGGSCTPLPTPFTFPTPAQLSCAGLEELQELKLGYRARYIHRLCQDAVSGALDLDRLTGMSYGDAMEYLTGFYGIGKKVANCVCLFGLHHVGAFPVDTWIEKILTEQYYDQKKYRRTPKNRLLDKIAEDAFGQYGGSAGIMQQYIFYYERLRKSRL